MPELLTKHPDVAIQVLVGGGARCGPGQQQTILSKCRPERFCTTSSGEVCIFGLDEVSHMTQVTKAELCGTRSEGAGGCGIRQVAVGAPAVALLVLVMVAVLRRLHSQRRR